MDKKKTTTIVGGIAAFNLKETTIDLTKIGNRRFMFNPKSCTFLIGAEDESPILVGSHAEEFHNSGCKESFDDFVRGWIGYNKGKYKNGIIHFSPQIVDANFDRGFDTLLAFTKQVGISRNTLIRGFIQAKETPICKLLPKRF